MKIRVGLAILTVIGAIQLVGPSGRVLGQIGINPPTISGADAYWNSNRGGLQQVNIPPQGTWAQIIFASSKWIVIENEAGQQFPIASDRVRQFLVRWPTSADQLTGGSLVEVTGPATTSNTIIADHVDVYEGDAQRLVSPTVENMYGANRLLTAFDIDQQNTFGTVYWMTPEEYAMPNRMHVVSQPVETEPLRLNWSGTNWFNIQASSNGMTMTQITLGINSMARPGDVVYFVAEAPGPRSLNVSTLVLYKKIPFRLFAP